MQWYVAIPRSIDGKIGTDLVVEFLKKTKKQKSVGFKAPKKF